MYDKFEISLVGFMPNITTNHAITYAKSINSTIWFTIIARAALEARLCIYCKVNCIVHGY